jgi:branched-chain amino acid transport system substrate-binding protein
MTIIIKDISRRAFLSGTAKGVVGAAGLSLVAPYIANAQAGKTNKIGILLGKTGGFSLVGEHLTTGIGIYMDQVGRKMIGDPVETIWLDDPDPQTGQLNAQKLIDQEKVVGLIGGASSATSLAIGSVAARAKIPYVSTGNAAREITGSSCNRYMFREGWTIPTASRALAPVLTGISKRWYILVASYVFGADILKSMSEQLKLVGGELVGTDQAPSGTVDYSSFLLKIRQASPDVVMLGLPPGDMQNFLKQYVELGMDKKAPVGSLGLTQADVWAAGPDRNISKGLYFATTWYYNNPANTQAEKDMTAQYIKTKGQPPSEKVWEGWYSMKMLMSGFEAAKSVEPAKVVAGLESLKLDDGNYMRSWDHQMIQRFLVVRVNKGKSADKWDDLDILPNAITASTDMEKLYGSQEEIGCKMGAL